VVDSPADVVVLSFNVRVIEFDVAAASHLLFSGAVTAHFPKARHEHAIVLLVVQNMYDHAPALVLAYFYFVRSDWLSLDELLKVAARDAPRPVPE
jgi:hypothetical protein